METAVSGPGSTATSAPRPDRLAEYYQRWAPDYDEVYARPERQPDLAALHDLVPSLAEGRSVLEIAAGTGYWTQYLARTAASVTATDLNSGPLAVAARRDYGDTPVRLLIADAYRLDAVAGDFDLVFCGFWWSHVHRADVPRFVTGVRERAGSGAGLILLDNRYVPGSSRPVTRTGPEGDTYQQRRLRDGREYEVLKNFPGRAQLSADLAPVATGLAWTELTHYWLATCVLR
jgi:demethylmenaquinone methyltransferase/2-methoxy-6-polyprenyl-1,4-benzoquinol methylase